LAPFRQCRALRAAPRAYPLPTIFASRGERSFETGAVDSATGNEQNKRTAIGIAALQDRTESPFGLGLAKQGGRLELGRKAFSQAGTRRDLTR